ncbi:hypothetical protein C2S51_038296 [Perilla frutescens var. frutescens]|nr:hypothetical protein C2S51_038296 [Perilla frutescens var. frutescens]
MMSATSISANTNNIPMLNGSNFKDWKENILIILGCMDLDYSLRVDKPASLTDASSADEKWNFEKWDRSNRVSLMIIKRGIPEAFRGTASEKITTARECLAEIEKRFVKNDKVETSTLLANLISLKYKGKRNIREYIMQMSHIASKLSALKLEVSEDLLVHLVLISLPPQFSQFKVNYNCQKEKWTLNELISYCVQEEERLKQERIEIAQLASTSKDKGKRTKEVEKAAKDKGPVQKKQKTENSDDCFFCHKPGHQKKECPKYRAWRIKKGTFLTLVCSEVNLASVPGNTWWLDSGATTHSVSMQGCLSCRKPIDGERYIYVGDGKSVEVEAIEHFRLLLRTGFFLDLKDTFIVSSFRRNSVSISLLDKYGFSCSFENCQFSLSLNSNVVGTGSLSAYDNLYVLDIIVSYNESLHVESRAEARLYRPNENKLDPKTVSSYFIGYSKKSRGFKFYDPTRKIIFETGNAVFFEDVEFGGRNKVRDITFEEVSVSTPTTTSDDFQASIPVISREVDLEPQQDNIENLPTQDNTIIQEEQPQELMPLRRSTRDRRNAIPDDYEQNLRCRSFGRSIPHQVFKIQELWIQEMICLNCGDRGIANAFVYCVKCLKVAVHRYCMDIITYDEYVPFVCDDCDHSTYKHVQVLECNVDGNFRGECDVDFEANNVQNVEQEINITQEGEFDQNLQKNERPRIKRAKKNLESEEAVEPFAMVVNGKHVPSSEASPSQSNRFADCFKQELDRRETLMLQKIAKAADQREAKMMAKIQEAMDECETNMIAKVKEVLVPNMKDFLMYDMLLEMKRFVKALWQKEREGPSHQNEQIGPPPRPH